MNPAQVDEITIVYVVVSARPFIEIEDVAFFILQLKISLMIYDSFYLWYWTKKWSFLVPIMQWFTYNCKTFALSSGPKLIQHKLGELTFHGKKVPYYVK